MSSFYNISKFQLISPTDSIEFINAPVDFKFEEEVVRSKTTGGLVLKTLPDVTLTGKAREFLINEQRVNGAKMNVLFRPFQKIYNDFELLDEYFVDGKTISYDRSRLTVDFVGNDFDDKFRNNLATEFELNRETSIDGRTIPVLLTKEYSFKNREILLRSELENVYAEAVDFTELNTYFAPPLRVKTVQDNQVVSDDRFIGQGTNQDGTYGVRSEGGGSLLPIKPELTQFYYDANDREKSFKLGFDLDFDMLFPKPTPVSIEYPDAYLMLQRSLYDPDTQDTTTVSLTQIHHWVGVPSFDVPTNLTFNNLDNPFEVNNLLENEMLSIIIWRDSPFARTRFQPNKMFVRQTEDSLYDALNPEDQIVDCVPIFDAFQHLARIIDPDVIFESDFIRDKWDGLILFSGETCRHVLYNEEKPPVLTTSFKALTEYLFKNEPCQYLIEKRGNNNVLRIEGKDYVYRDEIVADLGVLETRITQNDTKIFGKVEIGNTKSAEVEGIYLLYATHTLNTFTLPLSTSDLVYKATTSFIDEPNDQELTFRKQFSRFPDQSTRRDKDVFVVDAVFNENTQRYVAREWDADFEDVSGIYSPDTSWNYRLTPMNCLLRHGVGFNIEYLKSGYASDSVMFASTKGDVSLTTRLIGGVDRKEDDDVPFLGLERGKTTTNYIDADAIGSYELNKLLKDNFYNTVTYTSEDGVQNEAYLSVLRIGERNRYELEEKA